MVGATASDGLLLCRQCKQRRPPTHFGTNGNGNRRRKCISCHVPGEPSDPGTSISGRGDGVSRETFQGHVATFNAFQVDTANRMTRMDNNIEKLQSTMGALLQSFNEQMDRQDRRPEDTQQPPQPPPPSQLPLGGGGQGSAGEFSMGAVMAINWLSPDLVTKVSNDEMEPEDLVELRHSSLFYGGEPADDPKPRRQPEEDEAGYLRVPATTTPKRVKFHKYVHNIGAFCQLWGIFMAIRSSVLQHDFSMMVGYNMHMHDIIAKAMRHNWFSVMEYHLEVHRNRKTAKSPASVWLHADMSAVTSYLLPSTLPTPAPAPAPAPAAPSAQAMGPVRTASQQYRQAPYQKANPNLSQPYRHVTCQKFNAGKCVPPCTSYAQHKCSQCMGSDHCWLACPQRQSAATGSNLQAQTAPSPAGAGRS